MSGTVEVVVLVVVLVVLAVGAPPPPHLGRQRCRDPPPERGSPLHTVEPDVNGITLDADEPYLVSFREEEVRFTRRVCAGAASYVAAVMDQARLEWANPDPHPNP